MLQIVRKNTAKIWSIEYFKQNLNNIRDKCDIFKNWGIFIFYFFNSSDSLTTFPIARFWKIVNFFCVWRQVLYKEPSFWWKIYTKWIIKTWYKYWYSNNWNKTTYISLIWNTNNNKTIPNTQES